MRDGVRWWQSLIDRYPAAQVPARLAWSGKWLERAIQEKAFSELHTHLLGMGSWKFWIDTVMRKVIPRLKKRGRVEWYQNAALDYNDVLTAPVTTEFTRNITVQHIAKTLLQLCESKVLRPALAAGKLNYSFTMDVVYSKEYLMEALDQNTIDKLANVLDLPAEKFQRAPFIVWNARKQQFEARQGITNTELLAQLDKAGPNSSLENALRNCFTMLGANGKPADQDFVKQLFQGQFTPRFFPMRYRLKDAMYEQYLEVLDELIDHVVRDVFVPNGVGYVEFSVGVSDVLQPWVFRHLHSATERHANAVMIRYLAGFPRFRQPEDVTPKLSAHIGKTLAQVLAVGRGADNFGPSLGSLESLRLAVQQTPESGRVFAEVVVGLDYLSDERDHPFCPFGLAPFTDFVKWCRREHNMRFGLRFHCGELHVSHESKSDLYHMAVSAQAIVDILDAFEPGAPTPLRIGHGVGFTAFTNDVNRLDLGEITSVVVRAVKKMGDWRVPIEVNLRSNEMLVVRGLNNTATVSWLTNMRLPVVLCTDNEGIWEIDVEIGGRHYHSVAGEFVRAIREETIEDKEMADRLVRSGEESRFGGRMQRRQAGE